MTSGKRARPACCQVSNMLITTEGGFDYTAADLIGWMQESGFHNMHIEPLTSGGCEVTR